MISLQRAESAPRSENASHESRVESLGITYSDVVRQMTTSVDSSCNANDH